MKRFTYIALLATTTQAQPCTFDDPTECQSPTLCLKSDDFVDGSSTGNPRTNCTPSTDPTVECNTAINMNDRQGTQTRRTCSGAGAPTAPSSIEGYTVSDQIYGPGRDNKEPCSQKNGDSACATGYTCGFLDRSAQDDATDTEKAKSRLNMRCIPSDGCGTTNEGVKADCTQPTPQRAIGLDGDYIRRKAGEDCHKTTEQSGCVEGHQCGSAAIMGMSAPEGKCIPSAECGQSSNVLGMELTMECSATAVAASIVSAIAILTQM